MNIRILMLLGLAAALVGCANDSREGAVSEAEEVQEIEVMPHQEAEIVTEQEPDIISHMVSGREVSRWTAPGSNTISEHPQGVLLSSLEEQPSSAGRTGGAYVELPVDFEEAASGERIRVSVTARSAPENGAESFAVAFSTNEVGNSGWRTFEADSEFQAFSFEYDVNPMREGRGDFVGIWADTTGSGRAIIVESVTLEVLADWP